MKRPTSIISVSFSDRAKAAARAASLSVLAAVIVQVPGNAALGQQNPFVGTWQSQVGTLIFAVDGHAWGQQLAAGVIYTSFGYYSVQGDVLSVSFDRVQPAFQPCPNFNCPPAMPMRPASYRVRFQGQGVFIWGFDTAAPTLFRRVK